MLFRASLLLIALAVEPAVLAGRHRHDKRHRRKSIAECSSAKRPAKGPSQDTYQLKRTVLPFRDEKERQQYLEYENHLRWDGIMERNRRAGQSFNRKMRARKLKMIKAKEDQEMNLINKNGDDSKQYPPLPGDELDSPPNQGLPPDFAWESPIVHPQPQVSASQPANRPCGCGGHAAWMKQLTERAPRTDSSPGMASVKSMKAKQARSSP